jgi:pyruvate/2-oxoglutarate dehydrogenase complex dihydrolipoamide acyltransferase (E2) component
MRTTTPSDGDSALRRAMMWAFGAPATAHIVLNGAADFSHANAYLAHLDAADSEPVTVQHLLLGTLGRVLREFPAANARVQGGGIVRLDRVGVAMPVNLLGHDGGAHQAMGVTVISDVDRLSLRAISARCRAAVEQERGGKASNPLMGGLWKLASAIPQPVLSRGLDGLARVWHRPEVIERLYARFPASSFLSNPGAVFDKPEGMLLRSVSMFVPPRIGLLGTMWGIGAVQDEVVAVDGAPLVRPMLPIMFLFDHRLIDGVKAGRTLMRFAEILQHPEATFGANGERAG